LLLPPSREPLVSLVAALTAASLFQDLSVAGGDFARSGANVSVALSEAAVAISRGSISAVSEAWQGIDLVNARATTHGSLWFHHLYLDIDSFTSSAVGKRLLRLEEDERQALVTAMQAVSPWLPAIADSSYQTNMTGPFAEFSWEVRLLANNYVGVKYFVGRVVFTPQWANPLWEQLAFEVTAEERSIVERIRAALHDACQAPWVQCNLDVDAMATAPGFQLPWWRMLLGRLSRPRLA